MIINVNTIENPDKIAPTTKYGGKIVECQPGKIDDAKSIATIECTDTTNAAIRPANNQLRVSNRNQSLEEPTQPKLKKPKTAFLIFEVVLSRIVAKSGIIPK